MNFLAQHTTAGGLYADELASTESSNLSLDNTGFSAIRRLESKNTTVLLDRNPFLSSLGDSSI